MRESDDDRGEPILTALRLESLRQTSMPVSPYMEKAFGYHGFRRYVAFTRTRFGFLYWMDGIEDGLSVVAIWDRFLNHPLIHPHLGDCRLKARTVDPEELTMFASPAEALRIELEELGDAILLDREKRVVWIGLLARVFLHLALAIGYREFPAADEEDADIPQTVDAALQRKLLDWLDRRLKAASGLRIWNADDQDAFEGGPSNNELSN